MLHASGRLCFLLLALLQTALAALLPTGLQRPLLDDWESPRVPSLPLDAIVLEVSDAAVWADETLEFNGLRADPRTPRPLQAHLNSFRLPSGVYCHGFDGAGQALSAFPWSSQDSTPDSCGVPLPDRTLAHLILQLLAAVNFLHGRGSAHLGLDAEIVRVVQGGRSSSRNGRRSADELANASANGGSDAVAANEWDPNCELCDLRLIGLGAAVRLQTASRPPSGTAQQGAAGEQRRSTYMLDSATEFHAPELLTSVVVQSNLRSLYVRRHPCRSHPRVS